MFKKLKCLVCSGAFEVSSWVIYLITYFTGKYGDLEIELQVIMAGELKMKNLCVP